MMHWWNLSKQRNIWMIYPPGDRETTDFILLIMVIHSIEEEEEEEVEEVEEEGIGFKRGPWKDPMADLAGEMDEIAMREHNSKPLQTDPNRQGRKMNGLYLLLLREEMMQGDNKGLKFLLQPPLLPQKKDYSLIGAVKALQEKEIYNKFSQQEVSNLEETRLK